MANFEATLTLPKDAVSFAQKFLFSEEFREKARSEGIDTLYWSLAVPDYGFHVFEVPEGIRIVSTEDVDSRTIDCPEAAALFIERVLQYASSSQIVILRPPGEVFVISREGIHEFPGPAEWIKATVAGIENSRANCARPY